MDLDLCRKWLMRIALVDDGPAPLDSDGYVEDEGLTVGKF